MKTASRVLGTAFFSCGFEVQDAPRYGAERRGAPTFAYVRASRKSIHERGVIRNPDLVIVGDDTLPAVPAAGVMNGIGAQTVMLIHSRDDADSWRRRLNLTGPVIVLPTSGEVAADTDLPFVGCVSAGAAARLTGVISREALLAAVAKELNPLGDRAVRENERRALVAYEGMAAHEGIVREGRDIRAEEYDAPEWIDLAPEEAKISAPAIHAAATSEHVKTGSWRTARPVIDEARCNRCWWICSTYCPESAIAVSPDGRPDIDYDHCKGCMICVAICPSHAVVAVAEAATAKEEPESR